MELLESLEYPELKGLMNLELAHLQMLSHVLQNSEALGELLVNLNDFSEQELEKFAEIM